VRGRGGATCSGVVPGRETRPRRRLPRTRFDHTVGAVFIEVEIGSITRKVLPVLTRRWSNDRSFRMSRSAVPSSARQTVEGVPRARFWELGGALDGCAFFAPERRRRRLSELHVAGPTRP